MNPKTSPLSSARTSRSARQAVSSTSRRAAMSAAAVPRSRSRRALSPLRTACCASSDTTAAAARPAASAPAARDARSFSRMCASTCEGVGCKVEISGTRDQGPGSRGQCSEIWDQGRGSGFRHKNATSCVTPGKDPGGRRQLGGHQGAFIEPQIPDSRYLLGKKKPRILLRRKMSVGSGHVTRVPGLRWDYRMLKAKNPAPDFAMSAVSHKERSRCS